MHFWHPVCYSILWHRCKQFTFYSPDTIVQSDTQLRIKLATPGTLFSHLIEVPSDFKRKFINYSFYLYFEDIICITITGESSNRAHAD